MSMKRETDFDEIEDGQRGAVSVEEIVEVEGCSGVEGVDDAD